MNAMALAPRGATFFAPGMDNSVSTEGLSQRKRFWQLIESSQEPLSRGANIMVALSALRDAARKAGAEDWDGFGARPLNPVSFAWSLAVISSLPSRIVAPDVEVTPKGHVLLEWAKGPRSIVSVSVGDDGRLAYAGLFGRSHVHGFESMGGEFPRTLAEHIERAVEGREGPPAIGGGRG